MDHQKVKSVAKQVIAKSPGLSKTILKTMRTVADIVGATLGPGGSQVLIERYEHDMPPLITKDGVTVFRAVGLHDAAQHCIMEAARDAAIRTASEAGDGTTSAAILSEAIVRYINEFCTENKSARPQKVVRRLEAALRDVIIPTIQKASIKADLSTPEGQHLLHSVAGISANGDTELADAVMKCFDQVGDEGNVTIVESSGPSHYEVEKIDGYPIPMGYEYSCAKFYPKFINDPGRQLCVLENPVFVLYNGQINDLLTCIGILEKVGNMFQMLISGQQSEYRNFNVVVVATGFSEMVLATFAAGVQTPNAINVFPLTIPLNPLANFQTQFLQDLSAITGAEIFDPINRPLDKAELEDLGPGVAAFEASRFRSMIIGRAEGTVYEDRLLDWVDQVQTQLNNPESIIDAQILQERLAKLTGGISKLRVIGSSNGELKEKRDRAEDAVCAVRGAIKHGCLPGGCWTLLKIIKELNLAYPNDPIINGILKPALMEPVMRLLGNCGMSDHDIVKTLDPILEALKTDTVLVYDAMNDKHGDPIELGVLDSTPAVMEAIRNSISIAALLGTLGGVVVYSRDTELERTEAANATDFIRNANVNEADERY